MVFSSTIFLFLFLPLVLLGYYLLPKKAKTFFLFIASLIFYAWGEDVLVFVMLFSCIVDFQAGKLIERGWRKTGLWLSVVTNISLLGCFKYFNFTFDNINSLASYFGYQGILFENIPTILLPIGISFYTFQTLSYTIDVYRGKVSANHNFIDFAAYVTMFPQLVAGPIVRYADINKQLKNRVLSWGKFYEGSERFIIGLAKKVLIANTFASVVDAIYEAPLEHVSSELMWLAAIAYTFQIYFDFSGYSDMAIGLGKMFGFDFLENFNYPYVARSIRDFWRRWHISLSTWFRDYVYISLGGNRRGALRTYVNLFLVFFVTGLWHGASWNFVVWGLFHGFFIVLERVGFDTILKVLGRPIQHAYTLLVVVVGWVLFRIEDLEAAGCYLYYMFLEPTTGDMNVSDQLMYFQFNDKTWVFLIIAILLSTPIYNILMWPIKKYKIPLIKPLFLVILFMLSIIYVGSESYNPFIYFRF